MNSLTPVIRTMLASARQAEGRPMRRSTPEFFFEVVQQSSGNIELTLERLNETPTQADWNRIIAAWPERVPEGVVPAARTEGRRHALIGRWPRPVEVGESA